NEDIYKIFMTGVDGTPMPSFADVIQPSDAWDLVHFLRTLQTNRHSKENDILNGSGEKGPVTTHGIRDTRLAYTPRSHMRVVTHKVLRHLRHNITFVMHKRLDYLKGSCREP